MGLCVNIFGIPFLEDRRCRNSRKRLNNANKADARDSKNERVTIRNYTDVLQTEITGETPFESGAGAVIDPLAQLGALYLTGGAGGLYGAPPSSSDPNATLLPLALAGVAGMGVVYVATRK